jgi:hypothetical protein
MYSFQRLARGPLLKKTIFLRRLISCRDGSIWNRLLKWFSKSAAPKNVFVGPASIFQRPLQMHRLDVALDPVALQMDFYRWLDLELPLKITTTQGVFGW